MDEAVFFIFLKDGKILIEYRLETSEEPNKVFLPCGGIEESDREGAEDYRINAMKREIREEMGEQVQVKECTFLTTAESAEKMAMYHSYLIHEWEGELPEYSLENGVKNAKLVWRPIPEAFLEIESDVARTTVGKAIAVLRESPTE